MAFGLKYVEGAELARVKATAIIDSNDDSGSEQNSSASTTPNQDANTSAAASPAPQSKSVFSKPEARKPFNRSSYSDNKKSAIESNSSTHQQEQKSSFSLPKNVQAKRMLLEVAAFMNWTQQQISEKEAAAENRPSDVISEMADIINNTIKPSRISAKKALSDAMANDPDSVVFTLSSSTGSKMYKVPKAGNDGMDLLNGVILEKVTIYGSPFQDIPDAFVKQPSNSGQASPPKP